MSSRPASRPDDGQVLPLAALLVLIALGLVVVVGRVGAVATDRAQAQTAADAAALVGVVDGRAGAARAAARNGAALVRFDRVDGAVLVEVRVGAATASARAAIVPDVAMTTSRPCDGAARPVCQPATRIS